MPTVRTSSDQKAYLAYIKRHPGCSRASVIRACPYKLHRQQAYAALAGLIRRGFINTGDLRESDIAGPATQGLYITDKGYEV